MTQLLDIFGFLSVVLRGLTLALQSMVGGGIVFALLVDRGAGSAAAARACRRLLVGAAAALALIEACYVAADSALLMGTANLRLGEVAGANFFVAGAVACGLALAIAVLAAASPVGARAESGEAGGRWRPAPALLATVPLGLGILAASVATSHAAARLDDRILPIALTALHQAATACWIGGLPYLLLALPRSPGDAAKAIGHRFSRLAQASVAALVGAGIGLTLIYVARPDAAVGTAYGAMVGAKIALLGLLLGLGALNYSIVHGVEREDRSLLLRLRRFAEAEVGIGFTVVLAAASLTSQPPAADLPHDLLVTPHQIVQRFTPRAPHLMPPAATDLLPSQVRAAAAANAGRLPDSYTTFVPGQVPTPSTPADIAVSEFNHNMSGLAVLLAGLLAVAARAGWSWARNWPFAFLLLAVFLFLLADTEYWPIGPIPFWRGFLVSEALQHRLAVLLIVAFAVFERQVQMGRATRPATALVFPFVCFLGGALLLTHSHSLNNPKEELLAELSHVAIAILGVAAGWSRWLELRLDSGPRRAMSWVWPICLILVGVVLLNYRES